MRACNRIREGVFLHLYHFPCMSYKMTVLVRGSSCHPGAILQLAALEVTAVMSSHCCNYFLPHWGYGPFLFSFPLKKSWKRKRQPTVAWCSSIWTALHYWKPEWRSRAPLGAVQSGSLEWLCDIPRGSWLLLCLEGAHATWNCMNLLWTAVGKGVIVPPTAGWHPKNLSPLTLRGPLRGRSILQDSFDSATDSELERNYYWSSDQMITLPKTLTLY